MTLRAGERRALKVYRQVRQFVPALASLVGAAALALYPLGSEGPTRALIAIVGVVFALVGALMTVLLRPTRNHLLEDIAALHKHLQWETSPQNDRMAVVLSGLMQELKLTTTRDRLSLFARCEDGEWLLVGRYSQNAALRQPSGRKYQADQGLVSQTWRDQQAYISDLPPTRGRWEKRVAADFNMGIEDVRQLRMQSLTYACMRVERKSHDHSHPVGVLIAESERSDGVRPEVLDELERHGAMSLLSIECEAHVKAEQLRGLRSLRNLR